jgi:hypothetical protein
VKAKHIIAPEMICCEGCLARKEVDSLDYPRYRGCAIRKKKG